jgi:glycosyltransferase involved in cell wall biosynthesis
VTDAVPSSPYAVAKWASSAYARMFHALYQFPAVIFRIFMVYGPGQRDLQKLIPYVIGSLVKGEVPKLTSGHRPIDWIYVDDVVEALIASALAKNVEGKTIDVGSGKVETVRTVVQTLARLMGSEYAPSFGAKPDRQFEQVRVADMRAAKELLEWTPKVSLEEGLKRTITAYQHNLESSACMMPEPRTLRAPRKISVIIPCLNAAATIGETLTALVEQAWTADWEVIIADNGSTDALGSIVTPFKTKVPSIKIIDASAKCGAAYARNVGVHAASGEGLLFCDADDIPGDGWAPALTGALMDHSFVAGRFEFNRLNPPSIAAARGGTQVDALQTCRFLPFPHAGAGSLGISRQLHYEVGGFDETVPIGEDTDYCMRVQLAGQKLVFVPDAVLHYRLRETPSETYCQGVRYAENAVYLYKKYGKKSSWEFWRWRAYAQSLRTLLSRTPELRRTPDGKAILAWRLGTHMGALRGSLRFGAPPVMAE